LDTVLDKEQDIGAVVIVANVQAVLHCLDHTREQVEVALRERVWYVGLDMNM
jgi:hypothetical protein